MDTAMNYNLRRPTIADAKAFGKRIGVRIRYSSEWREFSVGNVRDSGYFTSDVIDAMQTAYCIADVRHCLVGHRNF